MRILQLLTVAMGKSALHSSVTWSRWKVISRLLVLSVLIPSHVLADPFTFITIAQVAGVPSFSNDVPSINSSGTLAFTAAPFGGVFTGNGGPLTTIATTGGNIQDFLATQAINDAGTVAFIACSPEPGCSDTIYTGNGGPLTAVSTPFDPTPGQLAIDNDGNVSFRDPIPEVSAGLFSTLSRTSLVNAGGTVAFYSNLAAGGEGLFTDSGGILTPVAVTGGLFSEFFGGVSLNDNGAVAFGAIIYDGSPGIFLSPAPGIIVPVALVNDPLAGMHVANFSGFGSQALNDLDQVAFSPFLSIVIDGRETDTQAFIRADPGGCIALGNCQTWTGQLPPPLVFPTPEPSTLLLLVTAVLTALVWTRSRRVA